MARFLKVYKKMPSWLKHILKYIYGTIPFTWRFSKTFRTQWQECLEMQYWSESRLREFQDVQLRFLIQHAYTNVPYYRRIFAERGLTPADIQSQDDLKKLPILTKEIVRDHSHELRAENIPEKDVMADSTSGSTGKPLRLYYHREKQYFDFDPYVLRFFGWGGYKPGEHIATLLNWMVEGDPISTYNPVRRLTVLSAYNLRESNAVEYLNLLTKHQIRYLTGYPSMLTFLTKYLIMQRAVCSAKLKAIYLFGEKLSDSQRELIENYWGCRCFVNYSLKERTIMGVECDQHTGLHLCPDFGITEFLESDIEGYQRLIATSLTNDVMPLIRYDTCDIGRLINEECPCKRAFPLMELEGGREKNFTITKDGSYMPVSGLDLAGVTDQVLAYQVIQEKVGAVDLNIIKRESFSDRDYKNIERLIDQKWGDRVDVQIRFTNELICTPNYKNPRFIQRLKEQNSVQT